MTTKRTALTRFAILGLASAAALLALTAAPASAVTTHVFSSSFGTSGSGDGQLSSPTGVAVNDTSHDVYVADTGNARVDQFSSAGAFIRAFGADVGGAGVNVCTTGCVAGTPGSAPGAFTTPTFVAVDNDASSASFHDVYVADTGDNLITKFDASGALITAWGSGGQLDGSSATDGPFAPPVSGIAVDSAGTLDVIDFNNTIFKFAEDGTFATDFPTVRGMDSRGLAVDAAGNFFKVNGDDSVEKLDSSGNDIGQVTNQSATGLGTNEGTGDLFVDIGSAIAHYGFDGSGNVIEPGGSTCTPAPSSGCDATDFFGSGSLTTGSGVGVDSATDSVYVADAADQVDLFNQVTLPDVTAGSASNVGLNDATLNGHVDPAGGGDVTDCHFDWGTDTSYGQTAACLDASNTIVGTPGNPITAPVDVHADITGLTPSTTYHFRVDAGNANGTNQGQDQAFTTAGPPSIDGESSTSITKTTATLQAQINPDGLDTTCHFDYGTDTSYGTSVPCVPADLGTGPGDQSASQDISGLQPGTTYHFRVVASNSAGPLVNGPDATLTTLPVAAIDAVFASDLTPTSATLNARINPLGDDTACHFDYGTDTSYGTSVPCVPADLGSGTSDVSVSRQITGLSPDTTYHYRVVVDNTTGTLPSADHTFVYDTSGGGLPDNRAYEMVTPPQKNGALIGQFLGSVAVDFASDGSRAILPAIQCFAGAGSCDAHPGLVGSPYSFTRTTSGWVTTPLAPPAPQFDVNEPYSSLSADAGTELFSMPTPPAGQDDFYARQPDGTFVDVGPVTPPSNGAQGPAGAQLNSAATANLSHVVWQGRFASNGGASEWPFDATDPTEESVYAYVGACGSPSACEAAQPLLVGVGGPNDGPGSTDLIGTCGTLLGNDSLSGGGEQALSADGSTVYFTVHPCSGGSGANAGTPVPANALYARIDGELPSAHTVPISQPSVADCGIPCQSSPPGDAFFEGASADGSKVFFADTQQLVGSASEDAGDTAFGTAACSQTSQNGCNLYLYDSSNPAGPELIDVSAGDTSGGGPRVQGAMAISPDGSHVYFIAKGVLTATPNAQGQSAQDGADNLYAFERDATFPGGHLAFVAALAGSDDAEWTSGVGDPANVTPDGRFLVFTSHAALTPDVTRPDGPAQVFRYDAQGGQLVRVSIGHGGFNDNGNAGAGDASIVSAVPFFTHAGPARSDPTMSHDGAYVFFQSPVALTPQALDDVPIDSSGDLAQNVYEYHDGQVHLISDGKDTSETGNISGVHLYASDATGANVFFSTADQLVPQDTDTQLDVYDARIDGGFPFTPPPVPCSGDNCKPAPSAPPTDQTPGSGTASDAGNLTPNRQQATTRKKCKKHRKKCKKSRRAGNNGGGAK